MKQTSQLLLGLITAISVFALNAEAIVLGPYVSDSFTIGLYHFDEESGGNDPGNPIVNHGNGGSSLNMTDTGGFNGRDQTGGGGYGAAAYSAAFGTAFNVYASGDGTYHSETGPVGDGGGVRTAAGISQSSLQGSDGAFTYEAIVMFSNSTSEQTIFSRDGGSSDRGFNFRVLGGNLNFFITAGAGNFRTASLPTTGEHAFAANEWFHVALTYSGDSSASDNLTFYWTALDSSATVANAIGTATISADLANTFPGNPLAIGTQSRQPYRAEPVMIDEARISSIARTADQFIFVPEPGAAGFLAIAGLGCLLARGRRRK